MSSKLKSLIETRWNSVYDMLMSIISNHQELYDLLENKQVTTKSNMLGKLTCLCVNELEAICNLLAFFKNVTVAIESDKFVTLHNYWLTIRESKRVLAKEHKVRTPKRHRYRASNEM